MRTFQNFYFLIALLFWSCAKDESRPNSSRTVMVYMAANNNLASDAYTNLNQMEESFKGIDGKLVVYARIFGQTPKLYEVVQDNGPEIRSKVLKTYNEHNSSDPAVMKMVFEDMKSLAQADSYGAILWSHATNWAPADAYGKPKTRSFGDDNFKSMDVQVLKTALPTELDFLIFDACSMASVEVLYELRNVTPYILASPTEVLSVGMPYHQISPHLFNKDVKRGLSAVAKAYVAYYETKTGLEKSASFSLVATGPLAKVAQETRNLLSKNSSFIPRIDRRKIQRLDMDPASITPAFDFVDMLEQNFPGTELSALKKAVTEAVVFKANTSHFLGTPIVAFSGLSCYIPVKLEYQLRPFYETLEWSRDAEFYRMFWE
ncbi:clostripain-related cysteine peptidase [Sphingobacterium yanglingense]|uniref:Cysteine peptidase C11 family protein n=1 Tax=Sphingobacterium yanglingense TaxID=1437280 RepID=A0A4R6WS47_9SPHI|nr:clostripain-related cysteine peptidase [Sphingobacterium yanglingense]TDQ79486.1 cysteine peptidase C11 family protein [Sphingobacterium yanglingense]